MARLKNHRHEAFARSYCVNGFNGTKAARSAGCENDNAARQASFTWLAKPDVVARIQEIMDDDHAAVKATKEEIIAEASKMAMFNMADLYDGEGNFIPIHEQARDVALNISKIKICPVHRNVIEVSAGKDKKAATDMLMKHYNSYSDHEESSTQDINIYLSEKDLKA